MRGWLLLFGFFFSLAVVGLSACDDSAPPPLPATSFTAVPSILSPTSASPPVVMTTPGAARTPVPPSATPTLGAPLIVYGYFFSPGRTSSAAWAHMPLEIYASGAAQRDCVRGYSPFIL